MSKTKLLILRFSCLMVLYLMISGFLITSDSLAKKTAIFKPHKAFYTLKLQPSPNQSLVAYDGILAYGFSTDDCKMFEISLENAQHIIQNTGSEVSLRLKFDSQESISGDFYALSSVEDDSISGKNTIVTSIHQDENQARLDITEPLRTTLSQPVKLQFPIGRIRSLLDKAKANKSHHAGYLYDGVEAAEEFYYVFSSIVAETTSTRTLSPALVSAGVTDNVRSWQINSSYYGLDFNTDSAINGDRKPDFIVEEEYFANGLIGDGIHIIQGMRIASTLNNVTWLEKPDCYNEQ